MQIEAAFVQAWRDAVHLWIQCPEGTTWPGGYLNFILVLEYLDLMGLNDVPDQDKPAALTAAYKALKNNGTLHSFNERPN